MALLESGNPVREKRRFHPKQEGGVFESLWLGCVLQAAVTSAWHQKTTSEKSECEAWLGLWEKNVQEDFRVALPSNLVGAD